MNDRFWAKVLFKEFIRHYRKLDDAQIVADVRKSMDDLEDLVDDADSFGSKMVRWSMERVDQYPQARENGKKGGRPKKSPQDAPNGNAGVDMHDAPEAAAQSGKDYDQEARQGQALESQRRAGANAPKGGRTSQSHSAPASPPLPRNKEEVRLFAIDNGLDVDDANDWAEMNLRERHGRDKDGKPIRNWKGAILNYCKAMAAKRETA